MHPRAHSNGRHLSLLDLVSRRQEGSARPKQRHPKLKIVLEVNIRFGALRVVWRPFLMDRRATSHRRDVRSTSTTPHHSSLMSPHKNHLSSGDSE
jgi:hypothetical protein